MILKPAVSHKRQYALRKMLLICGSLLVNPMQNAWEATAQTTVSIGSRAKIVSATAPKISQYSSEFATNNVLGGFVAEP